MFAARAVAIWLVAAWLVAVWIVWRKPSPPSLIGRWLQCIWKHASLREVSPLSSASCASCAEIEPLNESRARRMRICFCVLRVVISTPCFVFAAV